MIKPNKMLHQRSLLLVAVGCLLTIAAISCGIQTRAVAQGGNVSLDKVSLVKMTDPVERSFSVQLPKGWRNQAYLARTYDQVRPITTSLSPDGATLLFAGDPRLPSYIVPTPYLNADSDVARLNPNPLIKYIALVPAKEYFPNYLREKFGKLSGFRITDVAAAPVLARETEERLSKLGLSVQAESVRITFDYKVKGKLMHALINGTTLTNGTIWTVDVGGVTTTGNPAPYNQLLLRIARTYKTDPQWKAQQQALHERRMAQLRRDYENQQIAFNASNQRHQLRMQAIEDAGRANTRNWQQRQDQSDANHRQFLNYITDEHTVVDRSGKAYQVDNSHQRYFINKRTNTYIGTKSTTGLDDLRRIPGVDPNEYEEVKVKP
ncbi:MAG: hypothetical protein H8F28_07780 [Fibrella sp.]|nr:hypothetical protein [Armatimonadota bacterium]